MRCSSKLVVGAVLVAVLATAFSFAFVPLRASQDEWWHLKAGKWITEQGRLPINDIFTYTGENTRWHNHEWLSQVVFYRVYAWGQDRVIGGIRALITFKAIVVTLVTALLICIGRIRGASWAASLLVALLAAEISRRTIYPRPPIFSYVLMASFLALLYAWKTGRIHWQWLMLLPFLMPLWGNLHGMVILGVFITACFAAGEFLENVAEAWRLRRSGEKVGPACFFTKRFMWLCVLTAATVAATCANPSGYHIFFLGQKFTNDPLLKKVIAEMLPSPFLLQHYLRLDGTSGFIFVPGYATFWFAAAALIVLMLVRRGRLQFGADYLLCAFFLYQGMAHWRLLPLFAIATSGTLAWLVTRAVGEKQPRQCIVNRCVLGATLALACVYVFAIGEPWPQTFFQRNMDLASGREMDPGDYPEPVMKFIVKTRFPDRMFSEINYCGYAIWWLSPEHHKLFTDNRFDVFGGKYFPSAATVTEGLETSETIVGRGWNQILDDYGVNFIVISRGAHLNARLRAGTAWQQVYYYIPPGGRWADGFNIWLRNDPKFADVATRAKQNFELEHPGWPLPEPGPPLKTP